MWEWVSNMCPRSLDDILEGNSLRLTVEHHLKSERKNLANTEAREIIARARGSTLSEELPARFDIKLADKSERVLYKLTWG